MFWIHFTPPNHEAQFLSMAGVGSHFPCENPDADFTIFPDDTLEAIGPFVILKTNE